MILTLSALGAGPAVSHLASADAAYRAAINAPGLTREARLGLLSEAQEHLRAAMPGPDRDLRLAAVWYRQGRTADAWRLLKDNADQQRVDPRWDLLASEVLFLTDERAQVRRSLQSVMNHALRRYARSPTDADRAAARVMMACFASGVDHPCVTSLDALRPIVSQLEAAPRRWLTATNGRALLGLILSFLALGLCYRGAQKPTVSS